MKSARVSPLIPAAEPEVEALFDNPEEW